MDDTSCVEGRRSAALTHPDLNLNLNPDLFSFTPNLETGEDRKLEFLVQPAAVIKVVGASVLLPCVATGYPAPHVRWMLGDKLLDERYEVMFLPYFPGLCFCSYFCRNACSVCYWNFCTTLLCSASPASHTFLFLITQHKPQYTTPLCLVPRCPP